MAFLTHPVNPHAVLVVRGIDEPIVWVLRPTPITCRDGRLQVTYVVGTAKGTRSRTARTLRDGSWDWLRAYETGAPIPWSDVYPYEQGETAETMRQWFKGERGHAMDPMVDQPFKVAACER